MTQPSLAVPYGARPLLLTIPEVARLLSVTTRQVYRYIDAGELEVVPIGRRGVRVKPEAVDAFIALQADRRREQRG